MEFSTLFLGVCTACICAYYFVLSKMSYFEERKVPYQRPIPVLGNLAPFVFQRIAHGHLMQKLYNLFSNAKYFGFYDLMTPIYIIRDPELIKSITIKNFDHFMDHHNIVNEDLEPIFAKNLFGLRGDHWREMRKLLSPSFTSSKMKMMFGQMCKCAENFTDFIAKESGKSGKTYDMTDILKRYATDALATCSFGISTDSFNQPNNEFFVVSNKTINFDLQMILRSFICRNWPRVANFFKIRVFPKEIENFFKSVVSETVKIRDEQGIFRPDMIQLLMETRDKNHEPTFDINEMTAQAIVLFLAGFDAAAVFMCLVTHEVAANPDVQRKIRAEMEDVLNQTNGKLTYEALNDMKYLDAVMNEVMRLHPVASFLDRLCTKDFEMPPATPEGKPVTVKPGDSIWISTYSLHHDPKYYPEPEIFNPDRFLHGKVDNSVYIPFGIGPRLCMGNRLALMEAKVMLFYLLWRCDLKPDVKTEIPMVLDRKSIFVTAKGGFWLKLQDRGVITSITPHLSDRDVSNKKKT